MQTIDLRNLDHQDDACIRGTNPLDLLEIAVKDDHGDPLIIRTNIRAFRMLQFAIHDYVYPPRGAEYVRRAACDSPMDPSLDEE